MPDATPHPADLTAYITIIVAAVAAVASLVTSVVTVLMSLKLKRLDLEVQREVALGNHSAELLLEQFRSEATARQRAVEAAFAETEHVKSGIDRLWGALQNVRDLLKKIETAADDHLVTDRDLGDEFSEAMKNLDRAYAEVAPTMPEPLLRSFRIERHEGRNAVHWLSGRLGRGSRNKPQEEAERMRQQANGARVLLEHSQESLLQWRSSLHADMLSRYLQVILGDSRLPVNSTESLRPSEQHNGGVLS
jgi:hypothetical protein